MYLGIQEGFSVDNVEYLERELKFKPKYGRKRCTITINAIILSRPNSSDKCKSSPKARSIYLNRQ